MDFPKFKYVQDPIKLKLFEEKTFKCFVCKKERNWCYTGCFYGPKETDEEEICDWCIHDGSAAKRYGISFNNATDEGFLKECDVNDARNTVELEERTPEYVSWQSTVWLRHCGDYCALVAYVGWDEIKHLKDELTDDINAITEFMGMSASEFADSLYNNGDHQGYLFQCCHCGKHRLYTDVS